MKKAGKEHLDAEKAKRSGDKPKSFFNTGPKPNDSNVNRSIENGYSINNPSQS